MNSSLNVVRYQRNKDYVKRKLREALNSGSNLGIGWDFVSNNIYGSNRPNVYAGASYDLDRVFGFDFVTIYFPSLYTPIYMFFRKIGTVDPYNCNYIHVSVPNAIEKYVW